MRDFDENNKAWASAGSKRTGRKIFLRKTLQKNNLRE